MIPVMRRRHISDLRSGESLMLLLKLSLIDLWYTAIVESELYKFLANRESPWLLTQKRGITHEPLLRLPEPDQ